MPRPTKLTPELQAEFCAALERCWHLETAADLCGLARSTVYNWIKRGKRAHSGIHREFLGAVKKSLAQKATDAVEGIQQAGQEHWQALAWLLERKYPEKWSSAVGDVKEIRRWIAQHEREREGSSPPQPALTPPVPDPDEPR